jgi:hypothetical protein
LTPDRKIASVQLYIPEDALRSEQTANYNPDAIGAFMGALSEFTAQSGGDFMSNMAKSTRGLVDASFDVVEGGTQNLWENIKAAGGGVAATALKSIGDLSADALQGFSGEGGRAIAEQVLFAKLLNTASTRFGGAVQQATGLRVNPRTDVLFDHVQYREHTFEYMLIPRSLEEAKSIDQIIHMFQFYMLPSYSPNLDGKIAGTMIGFPYEFEISFWNEDQPAWHHINKIGRSVLTSVAVDHAAGGSVSFYKGEGDREVYPVATKLSLRFQEVRLLARDSVEINRGGLVPPDVGSEFDPKGRPSGTIPGAGEGDAPPPVDTQTQGVDTDPVDGDPKAERTIIVRDDGSTFYPDEQGLYGGSDAKISAAPPTNWFNPLSWWP